MKKEQKLEPQHNSDSNADNSQVSPTCPKPIVVRSPLMGEMQSFQEEFISKLAADINRKKDELVKQKLEEKGFGYLIEGIESRRFPKICCVRQGNWSYYFADNNTDEGAFIVAIEEYNIKNDLSIDRCVNMTVAFNWQDTYSGEVSFGR